MAAADPDLQALVDTLTRIGFAQPAMLSLQSVAVLT